MALHSGWLGLTLAASSLVVLQCAAVHNSPVDAGKPGGGVGTPSGASGSAKGSPLPAIVLADHVDADRVVVDGTDLFWANAGTGAIVSMNWHTLAIKVLASSQTGVQRLAIDASRVYWTKGEGLGGGGAYSVARVGGKVEMLTGFGPTKVGGPKGIAVTNDGVYLAWSIPGGTVERVRKDGQPDAAFATEQAMPTDVAVDSGSVYWTVLGSGGSNGVVMKRPLDLGVLSTVAHHQASPAWLVADAAGSVFWIVSGVNGSSGAVLKNSGAGPIVLAPVRGGSGLAVDDTWVYFTSREDGLVQRVRKDGSERTLLARDQGSPCGVALASDTIFWVNRTDQTIVTISK
ncbi:MAG: hypothetical protein JNL79_24985 [Myxococcales bacterium]|nr:hypothetical protein [Myxococcales bacterium]